MLRRPEQCLLEISSSFTDVKQDGHTLMLRQRGEVSFESGKHTQADRYESLLSKYN